MVTSFESVKEVFERVFQQALDDKGLKVMEAQKAGYLADRLENLAQSMPLGSEVTDRPVDGVVGPQDGNPMTWIYDSSGVGLIRINDGVSENELLALAGKFYEYDL